MIVTLPGIMGDLSTITAEKITSRECLTSKLVSNNLSYLPKDNGARDIDKIGAFVKGKQWLLWQTKPLTCLLFLTARVCWRWPEQQRKSERWCFFLFFSLQFTSWVTLGRIIHLDICALADHYAQRHGGIQLSCTYFMFFQPIFFKFWDLCTEGIAKLHNLLLWNMSFHISNVCHFWDL